MTKISGVEVIESAKCNNLADLLSTLRRISADALHAIPDTYVTINDRSVQVRLERQVLTDGSEVYNINIEP